MYMYCIYDFLSPEWTQCTGVFLLQNASHLEANFYVWRPWGCSHVKKNNVPYIGVIRISLGAHPSSSWCIAFPLFDPLAWSGVNGRSLPAPVVAKCCSSTDLRDGKPRLTQCVCVITHVAPGMAPKLLSGSPGLKPFFSQSFCTDTVRDVPPSKDSRTRAGPSQIANGDYIIKGVFFYSTWYGSNQIQMKLETGPPWPTLVSMAHLPWLKSKPLPHIV